MASNSTLPFSFSAESSTKWPSNDMLFSLSVLFMFKRLQKSRENRTCTDVLFIEYPHDLISDWLNSSKTYVRQTE